MNATVEGLKELHELHLKLQSAQETLDRGPKQVAARKKVTQRKLEEVDQQKQRLTALRKQADEKSLQMKTKEAKLAELRLKLNTANSNREFDIIKGQIEADTMANSVLEDEILELLEKVDQAQVELGGLNEQLQTAQAEEQRFAAQIAEAVPGLQAEISELKAAVAEAERGLPGSILIDYRRLVHAHGAGALSPVEGDACSACNVNITAQMSQELNTARAVFCRSCGRLLYREPSGTH